MLQHPCIECYVDRCFVNVWGTAAPRARLQLGDDVGVGEEDVTLLAPHANALQASLHWVLEARIPGLLPPLALVIGLSVCCYAHAAPVPLLKGASVTGRRNQLHDGDSLESAAHP